MCCIKVKDKQWCKIFDGGYGYKPSRRAKCSLNYYKDGIYLFGGVNTLEYTYNDLWVFYVQKKKWRNINTINTPTLNKNHSYTIYKNYVIIFGGEIQCYDINDMYVLNLIDKKFTKIKCKGIPSKRRNCCMCVINDVLLLHGGVSMYEHLNDAYYVSIKELIYNKQPKWNKIDLNLNKPNINMISYKSSIIGINMLKRIQINYDIFNYKDRNSLNLLMNGYLNNMEHHYRIKIPNDIGILIQKYYGISCREISYSLNNKKRRNCGISILNINNKSIKIFIFGGEFEGVFLNDTHIVSLFLIE